MMAVSVTSNALFDETANVVMLIYRPKPDVGVVVEMPPAELILAKQRNGVSGVNVDLVFRGPSMRFEGAA